jgi:hypothetical protein
MFREVLASAYSSVWLGTLLVGMALDLEAEVVRECSLGTFICTWVKGISTLNFPMYLEILEAVVQ